jgi:TonB family protein
VQRDYFGIAILGSLVFHILFFTVFHYTNLNAKPIQVTVDTPPIAISLYEEQPKAPQTKPLIQKQKQAKEVILPQKEVVAPKEAIPDSEIKKTVVTKVEEEKPVSAPKASVKPIPQDTDATKKYLSSITKMLQSNLKYPYFAKKAGLEGVATVYFCIRPDGHIMLRSLKILKTSGYSALDEQAIQTAQSSSPFPPPPNGAIEVYIPVSFSIRS